MAAPSVDAFFGDNIEAATVYSNAFSTFGTERVVVVAIGTGVRGTPAASTVISVIGASLTYTKLVGPTNLAGVPNASGGGNGTLNQELWWAHAAAQLTGETITITTSASCTIMVNLVAVKDCTTPASPWDGNVSLPGILATLSPPGSITYSTDNAYDLILLVTLDGGDGTRAGPGGSWFFITATGDHPGTPPPPPPILTATIDGLSTSVIQSGVVVSEGFVGPGTINFLLALVGTPPGPPPSGTALNMDNVVVVSLLTESPCTSRQFSSDFAAAGPSLGLRWSDTRGQTWGNPVPQEQSTDPLSQPQWNRTGMARDRVFELFWSSAFKTALNGAFVEVVPWKS